MAFLLEPQGNVRQKSKIGLTGPERSAHKPFHRKKRASETYEAAAKHQNLISLPNSNRSDLPHQHTRDDLLPQEYTETSSRTCGVDVRGGLALTMHLSTKRRLLEMTRTLCTSLCLAATRSNSALCLASCHAFHFRVRTIFEQLKSDGVSFQRTHTYVRVVIWLARVAIPAQLQLRIHGVRASAVVAFVMVCVLHYFGDGE